jgi:alpha-L-arabinofuranosidase
MYKSHMGGDALKVEIQSPTIRDPPAAPSPSRDPIRKLEPLHAADASASLNNGGKHLTITLVSQSLDAVETEIRLIGGKEVEHGELIVLTAGDVRDHNDFDAPNTVVPKKEPFKMKGNIISYEAPKHAVSTFLLRIK